MNSINEKKIYKHLLAELQYMKQCEVSREPNDLWAGRMDKSLDRFLTNGQINWDRVKNFRRVQASISELPTRQNLFPINWISGSYRGERRYGKDRLAMLKKEGDIVYLDKYPMSMVGNPFYFEMEGYKFNERWSRNVRYIHLAKEHLDKFLSSGEAVVLDIGGGYGIFSHLLAMEFLKVKSGIVEFPEQLLLTYYYLAMNFPQARINTLEEINEVERIDEKFVSRFDFLLIPPHCYLKIVPGVFNMVANFNSFAEMSEKWFNSYLDSDVFKDAEYFYTLNRFDSRPTYDTDLNILDYRLQDFDKLYFRISPLFGKYYIGSNYDFFVKQEHFASQCFEFIGKRPSEDR